MTPGVASWERAGLALRGIESARRDAEAQAVGRYEMLHRLGVHLPLLAVHDVGAVLSDRQATSRQTAPPPGLTHGLDAWAAYLEALRNDEAVRDIVRMGLPAGLLTVTTLELLRPVVDRWPGASDPAALQARVQLEDGGTLEDGGVAWFEGFLAHVAAADRSLAVTRDRLDLDTLRLLAMLDDGALHAPTAEELATWLRIFRDPTLHDIVNFTLEIMPSVLEARRRPAAQSYAVNGYRGLTRAGTLDDLLLTEFAYDTDVFLQRYVESELFFHERERARDKEPERHLLLIDGTASMLGLRNAFARGVALAMSQQLVDQKKHVEVGFFDSALHPRVVVKAGGRTTAHVLGFHSQRGRDYQRAFEQLLGLVVRLRQTSDAWVVTFITHGRCTVPGDLITRIAELVELCGVFILPGGALPHYVGQLTAWQTIDEAALARPEARREAARRVLTLTDQRT